MENSLHEHLKVPCGDEIFLAGNQLYDPLGQGEGAAAALVKVKEPLQFLPITSGFPFRHENKRW